MEANNIEFKADEKLRKLQKSLTLFSFFSFSLMFLLSFILTLAIDSNNILLGSNATYYFFSFLITIYIWFLLTRVNFDFDKFIKPISIYIVGNIFYLCLTHVNLSFICFSYYIPIIIISRALHKTKITIALTIIFIFLCLITKPLSIYLGIFKTIYITPDVEEALNFYKLVTTFITLFFTFSSVYFFMEFWNIKKISNQLIPKSTNNNNLPITNNSISYQDTDKFEILYQEILALFESEKPYQNPEFSIKILSRMLNTNHVYVSKTLNEKSNKSFKHFINHYRINQILEDFDKRKYKKHTIESIYTKAGFTQQSTFNRVFKELKGLTPSEYIEQIESNFSHVA